MDFQKITLKEFVDIPSSTPKVIFTIPQVGISNRPTHIQVLDPFDQSRVISLYSDIKVSCDLKGTQRGLHMSRIEECMEELRNAGLTLKEYVLECTKLIQRTQGQSTCKVDLKSFYEKENNSNPSKVPSRELIHFVSSCKIENNDSQLTIGVEVPFINACPCTQRWGMRAYYNTLKEQGYSHEEAEKLVRSAPLQAHTNGGIAKLYITNNEINHTDLYDVLDRSLPIIRELLKGQDEHSVVRHTHEQGQFCEDNIRSITAEVVKTFSDTLSPNTPIKIHVEVNESVHFHNLWAEVDMTLGEIVQGLKE